MEVLAAIQKDSIGMLKSLDVLLRSFASEWQTVVHLEKKERLWLSGHVKGRSQVQSPVSLGRDEALQSCSQLE